MLVYNPIYNLQAILKSNSYSLTYLIQTIVCYESCNT